VTRQDNSFVVLAQRNVKLYNLVTCSAKIVTANPLPTEFFRNCAISRVFPICIRLSLHSMRFGARQQPRTEEPQPTPPRGGAGRLSFCRQLLGALDMACFDRFPGRLTKPIGVADQQKQWSKVGSATRADRRTPEARLADGALRRYIVCGQRPSTKNSSSRSSALALLSASASFERIARSILSCSSIASC